MNKLSILILLLFVFILPATKGIAQEKLYGLWEIREVMVGGTNLTPLGKWSRIHADGRFETGNGWLQNGSGTYDYNPETGEFLPVNTLGTKDQAGPFTVTFDEDKMIWERMEGDMFVRVVSERIEQ